MNLNAGEWVFVSGDATLGATTAGATFYYQVGYQLGAGTVNGVTYPGYASSIPAYWNNFAFSYIFPVSVTGITISASWCITGAR